MAKIGSTIRTTLAGDPASTNTEPNWKDTLLGGTISLGIPLAVVVGGLAGMYYRSRVAEEMVIPEIDPNRRPPLPEGGLYSMNEIKHICEEYLATQPYIPMKKSGDNDGSMWEMSFYDFLSKQIDPTSGNYKWHIPDNLSQGNPDLKRPFNVDLKSINIYGRGSFSLSSYPFEQGENRELVYRLMVILYEVVECNPPEIWWTNTPRGKGRRPVEIRYMGEARYILLYNSGPVNSLSWKPRYGVTIDIDKFRSFISDIESDNELQKEKVIILDP